MINKEMNTNKSANEKVLSAIIDKKTEKLAKPNESSGIYFSSSIKITDPNTNEVLVQVRGDS
jgi:hypothetical protein